MNVYGKIESEKFVFLALERELDEEEKKKGWHVLGEAQETDYAAVMNGTWLGKPLFDENSIANYKLADGAATERTEEEKQAELAARPAPLPSMEEQVKANSAAILALMMGGMPNV